MDIAALIWDKNTFYVALIESPDAVQELAAKVRLLLVRFLDEWFTRYGRDFVAHYPDYYLAAGVSLSEDEIGAVNPDMFYELFLPELAELSERYGGLGMHCCADAHHHWPAWQEIPALRLLNVVQPVDQIRAAYERFGDATAQMHSWCGHGDPRTWRFPAGSRVVIAATAGSRDEAQQLTESLRGVDHAT
jgi:hypothetical protein